MTKKLMPLAVAGLVLAGCGAETGEAAVAAKGPETPTTTAVEPLEVAWSSCQTPGTLADERRTLILDTEGKDDFGGDSFDSVMCVLNELAMPTSVESHITSTRALDGMQTDSWGDFSARWTYHPDDGLQITITRSN